MSLGTTIARLRLERDMTQTQLAAAVSVSKRSVIRIEQGQTSLTLDILGRYADALGIRRSKLLRLSEEQDAANHGR
ncbi:helix-turn-helix domain-containing protein [Corynebacterium variabile]|uniref:helix-turn-helix domain-containing protein n=1 Tax=Corynebacterium variabile TaxID=1727 RepID=UPI003F919AF1